MSYYTPSEYPIKRALISVSDKTGVVEFARELANLGIEIFSTGGTKALLQSNDIPVKYVTELTNFPEILEGRVKTLHPGVHAGLLADLGKENHRNQLEEHNLSSIDLLVVNLYPFEETLKKENVQHDELIENIDIGGPAMLRASAKNYKWTAVIVNPENYSIAIEQIKESGGIEESFRAKLAGEVFSHTAHYDSLIANYFNKFNEIEFPKKISISMNSEQSLRYGENPHQSAHLYGGFSKIFTQLHGKELSYNNIIDIDSAAKIISEFDEEPTVAIVKHTNPCGVGRGENLLSAYQKAFATDTVSPFGGIVSFNQEVNIEMATAIHGLFTEVLIAPSFSEEAFELLNKKKDRRLIVADLKKLKSHLNYDFRSVIGGMLIQKSDIEIVDSMKIDVVSDRQPSNEEWKAMLFAWKVCKHVKSNAIVYASDDRTLGIGAGQMSRVDSSRIAVEKSKLMNLTLQNSVIASDAFFPFADGVLEAVNAGATAIIQPGGSVRDADVIKAVNDNNMAMIFTGARHFRH